jgi:hypothetical protein
VLLMVLGGAWLLLSKKIVKSQPAVA